MHVLVTNLRLTLVKFNQLVVQFIHVIGGLICYAFLISFAFLVGLSFLFLRVIESAYF